MKLVITGKAEEALMSLILRAREACQYAKPNASALAAALILDFQANATEGALNRVAESLATPRTRRRALLAQLAALSRMDEENALRILEKSVRKLDGGRDAGSKSE